METLKIVWKSTQIGHGKKLKQINSTLWYCLLILQLELNLEVDTFLHARSADLYTRTVRDTCPLKVWVNTTATARVEFGSTNRVRIFSNDF